MGFLIFGAPCANDVAEVTALVLDLGVVAHCLCSEVSIERV